MFHKSPVRLAACAAMLAVALFSGGCSRENHQVDWWQRERETIELTHQLELKKFRFEQVVTSDFAELERLQKSSEKAAIRLESLHQRKTELARTVDSLESQWEEFKNATLQERRQVAIGKTFEKLSVTTGREYKNVSVSAINDSGVTIRHSDGSARLRFDDLDASQRKFFGLDADLASAAVQGEAKTAAAYEQWVDARVAEARQRDSQIAEISQDRETSTRNRDSELLARQIVASNARTVSPFSRSSRSESYSTYRTYRPTYRYVYYNNAPSYYCGYASRLRVLGSASAQLRVRERNQNYVGPRVARKAPSFADTTTPSNP